MLNLKMTLIKILQQLKINKEKYANESFSLGVITATSGTVGSVSETISVDITKSGYSPIALGVSFVNTSAVGFRPFYRSNTAYVQVVRGQTAAYTGTYTAYLNVLYVKQ